MTKPHDIEAIATLAREAKARADRATPGPWLEDECCIFSDTGGLVPDGAPLFTVHYDKDRECSADESQRLTEIWREQHANADFIVAARTDVTALADAVLALAERVRELERDIGESAIDASAEHARAAQVASTEMTDRAPITVLIRNNSTGEIVEHADDAPPANDENGDEYGCGLGLYMWDYGNYACDCNRGTFFCAAKGIEDYETPCGESEYSVRILRDGMVIYDEWEDE